MAETFIGRILWLSFLVAVCLITYYTWSCEAKKDCMIDSEIGWYDIDNVYTCEENQRCCKEYGNPSCCAEKNKWLIVKDQLILWGGLFGFLSFLGLVVYCRRHDFYVLEGSNPCARCLGIKPKELIEEGEDEEKPIRT
ncbi:uncharacterized protein LOC129958923 [Argiope bruennichi]|uniref:Transmembrane protein n=1 Tax=Argiope bruennichi TaxID=94029 RepID=A0A8T0F0X9_ARGBR|nr:uncharacterized protein LOC129958923 [Argiope bruennichi]KAF8784794.1 hypothetical protein HNY73_010428 [Argiope bruennichi]